VGFPKIKGWDWEEFETPNWNTKLFCELAWWKFWKS
jgi:hypothetical protein